MRPKGTGISKSHRKEILLSKREDQHWGHHDGYYTEPGRPMGRSQGQRVYRTSHCRQQQG
jgi:hypothetical protein